MIKFAKRDNNTRRNFLLVNTYLCKHIDSKPSVALNMFDELGKKVASAYPDERILCIGFAETATALGIQVASHLKGYYISTTREDMDNVKWFDFKEEHSHATEQKLSETDVSGVIDVVDRIVFVDDEITTGKTVMNIIKIMRNKYPAQKLKYSVASIINSMSEEALKNSDVDFIYLASYKNIDFDKELRDVNKDDGDYISVRSNSDNLILYKSNTEMIDSRRIVTIEKYLESCEIALQDALDLLNIKKPCRVLVLGTEEFMYPAIYIGNKLEQKGCRVKCKSTTRSPIMTSNNPDYPLHRRYKLRSFYDSDRVTYIYDLFKYDKVLIVSDGKNISGLKDLVLALNMSDNNQNIYYLKVNKEN